MSFNYEQSIWGKGTATLLPHDPTSIRLRAAAQLLDKVPDGSSVLEVGCGAGQFIRALKQLRPEVDCFGCDISESALSAAKQAGDGVVYTRNDENALPYQANSMDAIFIFDVLEHVQNPAEFLRDVQRVLKPNGLVYAFVPCENDWLSLWHFLRFFGIGTELTKKHAGHINLFSRASLNSVVEQAGFAVVCRRYSEHCVGQLLGVVAFFLMERAVKRQSSQINNEAYFSRWQGGGATALRRIVNTIVYVESLLLSRLPSPNVHLFAKKK